MYSKKNWRHFTAMTNINDTRNQRSNIHRWPILDTRHCEIPQLFPDFSALRPIFQLPYPHHAYCTTIIMLLNTGVAPNVQLTINSFPW